MMYNRTVKEHSEEIEGIGKIKVIHYSGNEEPTGKITLSFFGDKCLPNVHPSELRNDLPRGKWKPIGHKLERIWYIMQNNAMNKLLEGEQRFLESEEIDSKQISDVILNGNVQDAETLYRWKKWWAENPMAIGMLLSDSVKPDVQFLVSAIVNTIMNKVNKTNVHDLDNLPSKATVRLEFRSLKRQDSKRKDEDFNGEFRDALKYAGFSWLP